MGDETKQHALLSPLKTTTTLRFFKERYREDCVCLTPIHLKNNNSWFTIY